MMKHPTFVVLGICILLSGCATSYGPRGFNGGYIDKPIDSTTYFLRYDGAQISALATNHDQLAPLWEQRAEELCGSKDYFEETQRKRIDSQGNETPIGAPVILGLVYCNNKFMDTRRQNADENFRQFINLPGETFTYKEISPLWDLLIKQEYKTLQAETKKLVAELSEDEATELLATFSRINPAIESYFTDWVNAYPESFMAYYARSLYYQNFAWFKRGSGLGSQLTQTQRNNFKKFSELAASDINRSISLNSAFCPSYRQKLYIYTALANVTKNEYASIFDAAKAVCPESIGIYNAHLRYLLPRWHGSKGEMRSFIDSSTKADEKLKRLEALYIAEEGDQLLFSNSYDKAIEKYTEALAYGSFASIYHQRALALENAKRYVESLEDYDTAVKISPYFDGAYEGITRVLIKQNNMMGAMIATTYLTALNNQDAATFEIQGDIFYAMRRYEDALVSYQKAAILSENKAVHRHKIKMAEFQIEARKKDNGKENQKTAI